MKYIMVLMVSISSAHAESLLSISLTREEAQIVLDALDGAVKSSGIIGAKKAIPVADKLIESGRAALAKDRDEEIKAAVDAAKSRVGTP